MSLSAEERSSIENAIWLCQNCAKLVDSDDDQFTVSLLQEWKHRSEREAATSIGVPRALRMLNASAASGFFKDLNNYMDSANGRSHWIDFVDEQLATELQAIPVGSDLQESLTKHSRVLQRELEEVGHSLIKPVGEALTDLGRLQSVTQPDLQRKFSAPVRLVLPISFLATIAIIRDLSMRGLPVELDLRFPDAITALDHIENHSATLPDGVAVGIGPTLMPRFAETLKEYLPVCILPPIMQEFVCVGGPTRDGLNVFGDIKIKKHDRYTNLELHADIYALRGLVSFERSVSTEPSTALWELACGNDGSIYGLWGLWATAAKRLASGTHSPIDPYFSDTLLLMHRRILTDLAVGVDVLKDAIGESWLQLRHDSRSRRHVIRSLLRSEHFWRQFSKFFVHPFAEMGLERSLYETSG